MGETGSGPVGDELVAVPLTMPMTSTKSKMGQKFPIYQ